MGGKRKRDKQTRLSFNPVPSTSPSTEGYNQQIRDRAAAVAYEGSPLSKKRRENDDAPPQDTTLPPPVSPVAMATEDVGGESDVRGYPDSKRRSARRSKKRQAQLDFSQAREPGSFSSPVRLSSPPTLSSPSGGLGIFSSQNKRPRFSDTSSDDEDDQEEDEDTILVSARKAKSSEIVVSKGKEVATQEDDEDDEDDEDEQIRSSIRTPGRNAHRVSQRPVVISSDEEDDCRDAEPDLVESASRRPTRHRKSKVDHTPTERSSRSRAKRQSPQKNVEEESDDDSDLPTPGRRKGRPARKATQEEQDDLDEDLRFLEPDSGAEDMPRQPRSSQSVKKNARLEALAQLKRKRAGQPEPTEILGKPDHEWLDDEEEEEASQDAGGGSERISSRRFFHETEEDQDFVIDEGEDLGVPDRVPIEFTQFARMKAKDLFKYAIEWMVQKKINPAFERDDELYQLTFRKLNDEVRGLAGSKFTSSAWTPQFTLALHARPHLEYEHFDPNSAEGWFHDKCDACNRSKHPASYSVKFQGKPYHTSTLEDVASTNDESDSDTSSEGNGNGSDSANGRARDAQGNELAPADTEYFVGRTCMANAQTAHALAHWRYHLYEWVTLWLTRHGYDAADKIVERDRMSTRKRRKHANKTVDRMEREGAIKTLWHEFKKNIDDARNAKQGGRFPDMDSP